MYILGVHLDSNLVRTALIRKGRQGIEIRSLNVEEISPVKPHSNGLDEGANVKPLYIKKFTCRTACGLSTKDFLIRSLEVKIPNARHIEEAVAFQAEAGSHFKPEDVLNIPLIAKREKGIFDALLFTATRQAMRAHLTQLFELGFDPDSMSTTALALCHFTTWKFPQLKTAIAIDIGSRETTCVYLENGRLKKAYAIAKGVEHLLAALLEDRKKVLLKKEIEPAAKQIDLLLLKPALNPHLSSELNELRQEIAKTAFSFSRGEKKEIAITGRSDAFIHLKEFLVGNGANEWQITLEEQKFAISIGLALEQTASERLQLLRDEFFPRKNWKRMGKIALFLLSTSLMISISLLGLGLRSSHLRKSEMLNSIGISKEEDIDQWIASIEKNNKEYAYILVAPKVAEVLSWLSTHPLLEELKREGDPIDLRDLHYELVTSPRMDSPKEPYLAKVDIEFQFHSAMNARKFHEALRKADLVNGNLEIGWEALNDGYRASFYLKNRSPHVP